MTTNMGRGILAPENNSTIGTGASEMRTLAATTAAAITDVDVRVAQKLDTTEAYDNFVPRDEAARYGIRGLPGKDGEPGPPGLPAAGAEPEDAAVAAFISAEHSQTGMTSRQLFADREQSAVASSQSTEIWVSPDGDDTNDGGTDHPLATIAAAVAKLPDIIRAGHTYTITLLPGEWAETLRVRHILVYGTLIIRGSSGDRDRHKVLRFEAESIIGHAKFENMTFTEMGPGAQVRFRRCAPFMEVDNVKSLADPGQAKGVTGSIGLLADFGSQVHVTDSDFSNRRYGIRANYSSRVFSRDNTGTNNTFGVGARWGGILTTYRSQPAGDKDITHNSGGIVSMEFGGSIGLPTETGLISQTQYRDQDVTSKTWLASRDTIPDHWIADQDIPADSTLRFRFRAPQNNVQYKIHVDWLSRPGLTSTQSVETKTTIFMRGNEITHDQTDVVHSYSMPTNPVNITARGSNLDFYLDITGVQARQGEWTAKISIDTSLGKVPILAAAELL